MRALIYWTLAILSMLTLWVFLLPTLGMIFRPSERRKDMTIYASRVFNVYFGPFLNWLFKPEVRQFGEFNCQASWVIAVNKHNGSVRNRNRFKQVAWFLELFDKDHFEDHKNVKDFKGI